MTEDDPKAFQERAAIGDPDGWDQAEPGAFFKRLIGLFYADLSELGEFLPTTKQELPHQYQTLLAHDGHMTVTLEAFHGSLVEVETLAEKLDADHYARVSVLHLQRDGLPVQLGIMRIALGGLPAAVRREIEARSSPLGRILIRHNVLRRVQVETLWRIAPGPLLQNHLVAESPIFGRTATILVEGRHAVDLLEIVKAPPLDGG